MTGVMWWAMTEMIMKGVGEDEGQNCCFEDDGTVSERDKKKCNEGGGVGDESNENDDGRAEDDRDVDWGENGDRYDKGQDDQDEIDFGEEEIGLRSGRGVGKHLKTKVK